MSRPAPGTFNEVVQRIRDANGALISVAEGLDFSTPSGRMIANVLATFAQFESETIGARVKNAQDHLADIGRWRGGRRPFGHRPVAAPDGPVYVLEVDDTEADEVRRMVAAVLDGVPYTHSARDLQEREVPTVLGSDWSVPTVKRKARF